MALLIKRSTTDSKKMRRAHRKFFLWDIIAYNKLFYLAILTAADKPTIFNLVTSNIAELFGLIVCIW